MKKILAISILLVQLSCINKNSHEYYMPAEFDPHEAVWIGWKHDGDNYKSVSIDMINALKNNVQIKMVTGTDSAQQSVQNILLKNNIDISEIEWHIFPDNTFWMRDHGAPFMIDKKGNLAIVDFAYNSNGMPQYLEWRYGKDSEDFHTFMKRYNNNNRENVDSLMGVSQGAKIFKSSIIVEGGGIEVNGKGTIILAESVTLDRNPGLTKEEIELEFKKAMNITNVIWLKKGLADDPHKFRQITGIYFGYGVGGHTDEFVRFANPTTIFLAWVNEEEKDLHPINRMNYERMSENLKILKQATDQDGNPFDIVKIPIPDPIYRSFFVKKQNSKNPDRKSPFSMSIETLQSFYNVNEGDTLEFVAAASYMNYFITNGVILLPTYINEGSSIDKEEEVKEKFMKYFPNRKLAFINTIPLNYDGGGMHCGTQQQPKRN